MAKIYAQNFGFGGSLVAPPPKREKTCQEPIIPYLPLRKFSQCTKVLCPFHFSTKVLSPAVAVDLIPRPMLLLYDM